MEYYTQLGGAKGGGLMFEINGENHKQWGMDHIDLQYTH